MSDVSAPPLLVGEIFVDLTITSEHVPNKLRLGGIVHAARGLWASGSPFRVAAVLPSYLQETARHYLAALGCVEFHALGTVYGAPNVTVLFDAREVSDQSYETLLRDEKTVQLRKTSVEVAPGCNVLAFPGTYSLADVCSMVSGQANWHIDVAYDIAEASEISRLKAHVQTIFLSTSSHLFNSIQPKSMAGLLNAFSDSSPSYVVLKENRGGSRVICRATDEVISLPAQLGTTINSVGVGDVFDAAFVHHLSDGVASAGWRATYASAAYAQTTDPDLFRAYVQRDQRLEVDEMRALGGTSLPWQRRQEIQIYFAAPDFERGDRFAIDEALSALNYHNFLVRRPVKENGELPLGSDMNTLKRVYLADCELLWKCHLLFAVPTGRDPGTLVEIGLAIKANVPVVVYDRGRENMNTMVMAGADHYSEDIDSCLNAVFDLLSDRT